MIDLIRNQQDLILELEDGEDLLSGIRYLTRSGVVWYQNDHRANLRNNFILDPMWLLAILEKVVNCFSLSLSLVSLWDEFKKPCMCTVHSIHSEVNFVNLQVNLLSKSYF